MLGDYSLGESRKYYRIATGNQSLAKSLATDLPDLRLRHVVSAISHGQNGVSVYGEAAASAFEVAADAAIVAVPVKCATDIAFTPALSSRAHKAFSSVPMGVASKLLIGTKRPPLLRAIQDVEMPYWCWTGMGEQGVVRSAVTAFCGSKKAQQNLNTFGNDPSIWLNKVQSALPNLEFADDPIMVDWSQDEWARGCYSAYDNTSTDLIPFQSENIGRVCFAGEHMAEESGTMEGAITSGIHAAQQIFEVLL
jgi:monoamine oxidase